MTTHTHGCYECGFDGSFVSAVAPRPSRRRVRICPCCLRVISRGNPVPERSLISGDSV